MSTKTAVALGLVLGACPTLSDDGDPDLAFHDLTMAAVVNTGVAGVIPLSDHTALGDCGAGLQVRDYTDPQHPGACSGAAAAGVPLHERSLVNADASLVVMWTEIGWKNDSRYHVLETGPAGIVERGSFAPPSNFIAAGLDGQLLWASTDVSRLRVYDLAQLAGGAALDDLAALEVGAIDLPGLAYAMFVVVDGDRAYVAGNGGPMAVLDVSDLSAPRVIWRGDGKIDDANVNGLRLRGTTLFMFSHNAVTTLDVSDPASPKRLGSVRHQFGPFAQRDDWVWIGGVGSLQVYDAREPRKLELVRELSIAPQELERMWLMGDSIVAYATDRTWYTPYENTVYFTGNKP